MKKPFFLSASFLFFGSVFAEEIYLECEHQFLSETSTVWIDGQCVATGPTPSLYLKIMDDYWEMTERGLNTADRTNERSYTRRDGVIQLCGHTYLSLDDWLLRAQTMELPSFLTDTETSTQFWLEHFNSEGTQGDGAQYTDTQINLFRIIGGFFEPERRELYASVKRLTGELYVVSPFSGSLMPEPKAICNVISKEQYESTLEDWNNKINEIKRAQQQFIEQRRLF